MRKILCKIFGHKPVNVKLVFHSENINPDKEWSTYAAKCKRCECNLISMKSFGEFSQEQVMSKFIEI